MIKNNTNLYIVHEAHVVFLKKFKLKTHKHTKFNEIQKIIEKKKLNCIQCQDSVKKIFFFFFFDYKNKCSKYEDEKIAVW